MSTTEKASGKNLLEWCVFAASCGVVLALLVALILFGIREKDGAAQIEVMLGAPEVQTGRVVIPVEIANRGHAVAADVEVSVTAQGAAQRREGRVAIDFIPRGAVRKGMVSFAGTEIPEKVVAEVAGFRKP